MQRPDISRRQLVGGLASAGALVSLGCRRSPEVDVMIEAEQSPTVLQRMPVLFAGHGSPLNAIEDNRWSRGFAEMGRLLPPPKAVLAISAHWYVEGTWLTADRHPRTIHDFYGFPKALYEVSYGAPGKVELAERVRDLLGNARAGLSTEWGLDHGTWSVLKWVFPRAEVPVVQLSIDRRLRVREHWELARSLAGLREQGVLIVGSGNVVHNLRDALQRRHQKTPTTPPWAERFDARVAQALQQHDSVALLEAWSETEEGRTAHPTPDHWLPIIYAAAITDHTDPVRFLNSGFDLGSISMRSVLWG